MSNGTWCACAQYWRSLSVVQSSYRPLDPWGCEHKTYRRWAVGEYAATKKDVRVRVSHDHDARRPIGISAIVNKLVME
eukprot:scaffold190732_cov22-Tisochrysis_lutea.AAC.1